MLKPLVSGGIHMPKTTKQILSDARDLISKGKWYTSEHYATDHCGAVCSPKSKAACKWCAEGAIYACDGVDEVEARASQNGPTEMKFRSEIGHACILFLEAFAKENVKKADEHAHGRLQLRFVVEGMTHGQVLQLFSRAIAAAA